MAETVAAWQRDLQQRALRTEALADDISRIERSARQHADAVALRAGGPGLPASCANARAAHLFAARDAELARLAYDEAIAHAARADASTSRWVEAGVMSRYEIAARGPAKATAHSVPAVAAAKARSDEAAAADTSALVAYTREAVLLGGPEALESYEAKRAQLRRAAELLAQAEESLYRTAGALAGREDVSLWGGKRRARAAPRARSRPSQSRLSRPSRAGKTNARKRVRERSK